MAPKPSLQVDLTDRKDVRAKLPAARRMADEFRQEVERVMEQANAWGRLVHVLEGIAGDSTEADRPKPKSEDEKQPEREQHTGPSSEEIVREILERTGRPMTTAEIRKLAPPNLKPDTVSWALWSSADKGQIQKIKRGLYAPLPWRPDQTLTFSDDDGKAGRK